MIDIWDHCQRPLVRSTRGYLDESYDDEINVRTEAYYPGHGRMDRNYGVGER